MPISSDKPVAPSRPALWAITAGLVIALALGGGEAAARLAGIRTFAVARADYIGWAKPDPKLGWRNNPGRHAADEGPHEIMTILPDGSRDTGMPAGATERAIETWIVGCSYAEGYGVRDDETFAWKLQQRFPALRVRDFGVPGYGTYQSLLLLRELIEQRGARPALVIYGFLPFHADRNVLTYSMLEAFRAFGGELFSPPRVAVRGGRLAAYPPYVVHSWPLEAHSALVALTHRASLRVSMSGRDSQKVEATNLLLAQMKTLVESAHGRLLVTTLWNGGDPQGYPKIVGGMRQAGIDHLDVTYAGAEMRPEKILVGGTGHPGAIIHSWWAGKLGEWLTDQKIVPAP